jgi:hypothetical protein
MPAPREAICNVFLPELSAMTAPQRILAESTGSVAKRYVRCGPVVYPVLGTERDWDAMRVLGAGDPQAGAVAHLRLQGR